MRKVHRILRRRQEAARRKPPPQVARRTDCTSYAPGHTVHLIQWQRVTNHADVRALSWDARVIDLDGKLLTVQAEDGDRVVRYRHHDPVRLAAVVERGSRAAVNDRFALLHLAGGYFSIVPDEGQPLGPCPTDVLPEGATDQQLVDRLETHGGFSARCSGVGTGCSRDRATSNS